MSNTYFIPLFFIPVIIDAPGEYITRCGEVVQVTQSSHRHNFGCIGTYSNNVREKWHKSGRIFATQESANDVVRKQ